MLLIFLRVTGLESSSVGGVLTPYILVGG